MIKNFIDTWSRKRQKHSITWRFDPSNPIFKEPVFQKWFGTVLKIVWEYFCSTSRKLKKLQSSLLLLLHSLKNIFVHVFYADMRYKVHEFYISKRFPSGTSFDKSGGARKIFLPLKIWIPPNHLVAGYQLKVHTWVC